MDWWNLETSFRSLMEALSWFLREHGFKYELSDCGWRRDGTWFPCWHFEIYLDHDGVETVNKYIDSISYTEVLT